jgi:hypothetical protein
MWLDALMTACGIVLVFMTLREFFCWYWKINRMVTALETIAANTEPRKPNTEWTLDHKTNG